MGVVACCMFCRPAQLHECRLIVQVNLVLRLLGALRVQMLVACHEIQIAAMLLMSNPSVPLSHCARAAGRANP